MKKIFFSVFIIGIFLAGCTPEPEITQCQKLALRFDELDEAGCYGLDPEADNTAGALLIGMRGPVLVNLSHLPTLPVEYFYTLTLKGKDREEVFRLVKQNAPVEGEFPYEVGKFYRFDFMDVCGPVFSMGPHGGGGIFVDNNFTVLEIISCG